MAGLIGPNSNLLLGAPVSLVLPQSLKRDLGLVILICLEQAARIRTRSVSFDDLVEAYSEQIKGAVGRGTGAEYQ